jgi:hypothetical protein
LSASICLEERYGSYRHCDEQRGGDRQRERERKTHEKRFSIAALLSALPASMRAATERNITRCRDSDIEINGYRQGNVSIIPEAFLTSVSWNKKKGEASQ